MLELLEPDTPFGLDDPAMDAKTIGERIRALREGRNLTQVELAKLISTSQQNVARWEAGTEVPGSVMPKIAAALKVPIARLFPRDRPGANPQKKSPRR